MNLCIFQGGFIDGVSRNLDLLERTIREKCKPRKFAEKSTKPDLFAFPELFLTGYVGGEDILQQAEHRLGNSFSRIAKLAKELQVGVVYGYVELDGRRRYNSIQFIGKDGTSLGNYRKTHLYSDYERKLFTPSREFSPLILFEGLKIGLLICYDIEFPEPCRVLALQGADLVIVPTAATAATARSVSVVTVPARAAENLCFVAYINRVGSQFCPSLGLDIQFHGTSVVAAPDASLLVTGSATQQQLLTCTIDPRSYVQARTVNPYFQDRVPSLYKILGRSSL